MAITLIAINIRGVMMWLKRRLRGAGVMPLDPAQMVAASFLIQSSG